MYKMIKSIFKRQIQCGYKVAIPKDFYVPNDLYVSQTIEIEAVEKGNTLHEDGLFIRFLDETQDQVKNNAR